MPRTVPAELPKNTFSPADYERGGTEATDTEKYILGGLIFCRWSTHEIGEMILLAGDEWAKTPKITEIFRSIVSLLDGRQAITLASIKKALKRPILEADLWGILADCEQVYCDKRFRRI